MIYYKNNYGSLYLGDCLHIMRELIKQGLKFDGIFTDVPYGTTKCKWDTPLDLVQMWECLKELKNPNTPVLLFAQTPFDKVLGVSNLEELKYEWIWEKTAATGHQNAKKIPMKAHENILTFYDKLPTYNPQKTTGHERKVSLAEHKRNCKDSECYNKNTQKTTYDSTERYPRSVQIFKSDKQKCNFHPTQKPLDLMEYLIKTYTNENDLILDFTCGSGTTLLAAQNLHRRFIGIELEETYCEITKKRLEDVLI